MENNSVVDALEDSERSFERAPQNVEKGLDVEEAELVQLRRACRLLAAASRLLDNGYYTVVIESSFVAIERTIQFRLIHDGAMEASEVISSHRRLYQRGAEVGLYDDAFGERLAELWSQNRTKTYYRLGIATEAQAEAMHELATEVHRDLVDGSQVRHECLC
jgi:HEPN domain-containing protein